DRRQTREEHADERAEPQDEAGNRLAAGHRRRRFQDREVFDGGCARLGDHQLPTAVGAPRPTARVLVPGLELLLALTRDKDGHETLSSRWFRNEAVTIVIDPSHIVPREPAGING